MPVVFEPPGQTTYINGAKNINLTDRIKCTRRDKRKSENMNTKHLQNTVYKSNYNRETNNRSKGSSPIFEIIHNKKIYNS